LKNVFDFFIFAIGIGSSLATLLLFHFEFWPILNDQGKIGILFLGFFAIFFFLYSLGITTYFRKRSRYSKIFGDLNFAFAAIHKIEASEKNQSDLSLQARRKLDVLSALDSVCTQLSTAFSLVHGEKIGVCMKLIAQKTNSNRQYVLTIARDNNSIANRNRQIDHDKEKKRDFIDINTDFNTIFLNEKNQSGAGYVYLNRLPMRRDYRNSRLEEGWATVTNFAPLDALLRNISWKLEYKTTLTCAIKPIHKRDYSARDNGIRGYLCIDSKKNYGLNKEIDSLILMGVSDAIYDVIDEIHQFY